MTEHGDLIERVARALLGEPNQRKTTRSELRFGTNGWLSAQLTGDRAGSWYDHESREDGDVLGLIMREIGGDRRDVLAWLTQNFGLPDKLKRRPRTETIYPYVDGAGELVFEVVGREPKKFLQRRPDGQGGYLWSIKGCRMVPYRLPETLEAIGRGAPVFIVEGEKDRDLLTRYGIPASCIAGGAGKWRPEHAQHFAGADVVIVPDNDRAGQDHAETVATTLQHIAERLRVIELPGLPPKADVSDWLDLGNALGDLYALANAAPKWRPSVKAPFPMAL